MTVGHCLRDHGTETKNNFDSVTRSLKQIEKDYHRAWGYVLSPDSLLCQHKIELKRQNPRDTAPLTSESLDVLA